MVLQSLKIKTEGIGMGLSGPVSVVSVLEDSVLSSELGPCSGCAVLVLLLGVFSCLFMSVF